MGKLHKIKRTFLKDVNANYNYCGAIVFKGSHRVLMTFSTRSHKAYIKKLVDRYSKAVAPSD